MKCMCPKCGFHAAEMTASGPQCPEPSCELYSGKFSQFVDAVTTNQTPPTIAPQASQYSQEDIPVNPYPSSQDPFYEEEEEDDEDDPYYSDYEDEDDYDDGYDSRDNRDLSHVKLVYLSVVPRRNTVEIQFCLAGDAGRADKRVEFLYWQGSPDYKRTATLTNRRRTFLDYVDADGRTIYKTHWKIKDDGLDPAIAGDLKLEPRVY